MIDNEVKRLLIVYAHCLPIVQGQAYVNITTVHNNLDDAS